MADARIETNTPGPSPTVTPINPLLPSLAEIQTVDSSGVPPQPESGGSPQSTSNVVVDPLGEPITKRRKFDTSQINEKLEQRLGGILCCAVCLDLPKIAVYQVIQRKPTLQENLFLQHFFPP